MKKDIRTARRLKTSVELNWFGLMPYASIYSVVKITLGVSRMLQSNLEYT